MTLDFFKELMKPVLDKVESQGHICKFHTYSRDDCSHGIAIFSKHDFNPLVLQILCECKEEEIAIRLRGHHEALNKDYHLSDPKCIEKVLEVVIHGSHLDRMQKIRRDDLAYGATTGSDEIWRYTT